MNNLTNINKTNMKQFFTAIIICAGIFTCLFLFFVANTANLAKIETLQQDTARLNDSIRSLHKLRGTQILCAPHWGNDTTYMLLTSRQFKKRYGITLGR